MQPDTIPFPTPPQAPQPPAVPFAALGAALDALLRMPAALERLEQFLERIDVKPPPPARHSPDYRIVEVQGRRYHFTPYQAAAVRVLWEDLDRGGVGMHGNDVIRQAGCETPRLGDLFREHPNWRELIVNAGVRNMYTLKLA